MTKSRSEGISASKQIAPLSLLIQTSLPLKKETKSRKFLLIDGVADYHDIMVKKIEKLKRYTDHRIEVAWIYDVQISLKDQLSLDR